MTTKRITRRQVQAWFAPIRKALTEIKTTGEVETIRGYAHTRLHTGDDYARLDHCIAGFRGLMERLCPDVDLEPMEKLERKFANGLLLEPSDIDAALGLLKTCEKPLMRCTRAAVKDAVLTEQVAIELEQLGLKEAA